MMLLQRLRDWVGNRAVTPKERLMHLAEEATLLDQEARALTEEERMGERGKAIRVRAEEIRRELEAMQKP